MSPRNPLLTNLLEVEGLRRVDPDHEMAGTVRLKGSGNHYVVSGLQLHAGEDLAEVDVGAGAALLVVVVEVAGGEAMVGIVRLVGARKKVSLHVDKPHIDQFRYTPYSFFICRISDPSVMAGLHTRHCFLSCKAYSLLVI